MNSPYKKTTGADVPLTGGVDQYGGVKVVKKGGVTNHPFDDDIYSTAALPKGVNDYGATEDLGEQGEAAKKYGTKKVPGMS